MCLPMMAAPLVAGSIGGATAAGATAGAMTIGSALASAGTIAGLASSVWSGISANRTAKAQAAQIEQRATTEAALTATRDQRERQKFMSQIRLQAAQLIGNGVSLDSPTAVMLGDYAGREMSFGSQAIRSDGAATQAELSSQARMTRAQGQQALLSGALSGAGTFLTQAPKVWPSLLS